MATGQSFTTYMQTNILKWIRKEAGFTFPVAPTTYLGLLVGTMADDGTGATEVIATGYARQAITWGTVVGPGSGSTGSKISNTVAITFSTTSAYTVNAWGVYDGTGGGANIIGYLPGFADDVSAAQAYIIAVGAITWLID